MDKVTQAMLSSKANSIQKDVCKNFGTMPWQEAEKTEETVQKEKLAKQASMDKFKEQQEMEREERDKKHQAMKDEREKERQRIRDKYKLKGSNTGTVDYGQTKTETEFSNNAEQIAEKKDSCVLQ